MSRQPLWCQLGPKNKYKIFHGPPNFILNKNVVITNLVYSSSWLLGMSGLYTNKQRFNPQLPAHTFLVREILYKLYILLAGHRKLQWGNEGHIQPSLSTTDLWHV